MLLGSRSTSSQRLTLESFCRKDGLDTLRDLDESFPEEVVQVITIFFALPRVRPKYALIAASKLQGRRGTFLDFVQSSESPKRNNHETS
jgi:hypothetical protein